MTGKYYLSIPDMDYQDLVILMQATEKSLPLLSQAIREFIETMDQGEKR